VLSRSYRSMDCCLVDADDARLLWHAHAPCGQKVQGWQHGPAGNVQLTAFRSGRGHRRLDFSKVPTSSLSP
jgi:hypothetical protein